MVGPVEVLNNGHTIQASMKDPGHSAVIDGKRYKLLQFHLHAPSENTLNGKAYAMELHLVHKSDDGKLAVVGVFFKEGAENSELAKVWNALPLDTGESKGINMVSPKVLLPKDTSYYSFSGSLTTPPCSEGVSWNVMKNPVTVSAAQVEAFVKLVGHNARPVQAGNGRKVSLN